MKAQCISVSGADGVGKTTTCDALAAILHGEGRPVHRCWLRFRHRVSRPLLAYARLRGMTWYDGEEVDGERLGGHHFQESPLLRLLFPWTVAADLVPAVRWHVHRNLARHRWVLADRFIPDTLVDLQIATGNHELANEPAGRALLRLLPENTITAVLQAPRDVLHQRRPLHADDPTVETRRALYRRLATRFGWTLVDATQSPNEIAETILEASRS